MSTPTIVRKVSNLANNNNTDSTNSPTTTSSPPIRPTRVVRVLSKSAQTAANSTTNTTTTTNGTTDNNNASTTTTTTQQQPTTSTVDQQHSSSSSTEQQHNDTPDNASSTESGSTAPKKVIKRVIKRVAVTPSAINTNNSTIATTDNNNTTNNNNISTITSQTPVNNTTTTNTSTTATPAVTPSSTQSSLPKETNEVVNTPTTTTTTPVNTSNPITPRGNVADRWLKNQSTTTTTSTNEPTTPIRRVINRNSLKHEEKTAPVVNDAATVSTPEKKVNSTDSSTPTENKNINSTSSEFGTKLVNAANKSHSTIDKTTITTNGVTPVSAGTSPHQTSKSMNDIPETKTVKVLRDSLTPQLKFLSPQQLMSEKKTPIASDNIRPLRPLEIATWYGGSVSVATEDPTFDNSSIDDLRKEAPDVFYTNYLFNPLFDEQSACDTPEIYMSAQEILQYNFVVELMRKKHSNLLTLDPIAFEEELKNASQLTSFPLSKNLSSVHTHTDSVTSTSTEDVLSREDIIYPINKCSKNWKYQLKKKRENAKTNFNSNDGMFTPRASIQLQSSSPSSPATSNSVSVNPLYDHLYYMPCWKHQLQIDQIVKRGGEQKKVQ